jgi:hypothetical protein
LRRKNIETGLTLSSLLFRDFVLSLNLLSVPWNLSTMPSFPVLGASAWPPHKEVFKEDAVLARRKQRVTLQAANLPVHSVRWSLDSDDPIFCLATGAVEDDRI